MSLRRPTAAAIRTQQGLLDVLCGLYDRAEKPSGGNLTQFIKTVVDEHIASGGAGGVLASFASSDTVQRTSGAEAACAEFTWPFNAGAVAKPTLDVAAAIVAMSASGTASFFLRVAGVLVGMAAATGAFAPKLITGSVPNPGGIVEVTLSIKSSAAAVAAQIRGAHVVVS